MPFSIEATQPARKVDVQGSDPTESKSKHRPFTKKALALGALLIGTIRSNPVALATVATGVGAFLLQRKGSSQLPPQDTRVKVTNYLNLPSDTTTTVMIVDNPIGDPSDPTHSRDVAFVANNHLDHSRDVRTVLYKPGVGISSGFEGICNLADIFSELSKTDAPPAVVATAVGMNSSNKLKGAEKEINKFSPSYRGPKPAYPKRSLQFQLNNLVKQLPSAFEEDKAQKCSNGLSVEQHLSGSIKNLVDAGTTVILPTNNAGQLFESLKELNINNPENAFDTIGYGKSAPDIPSLIVVGGVGQTADAKPRPSLRPGPSHTVDVAAVAANIKAINKKLTPAEIEQIIKDTATGLPGHENRVGAGAINPERAYVQARLSSLKK